MIVSNVDQLPTFYGRRRGTFGFGGFTITSVLLAEFFDIGVVADGNIIDFMYLRSQYGHGTRYVYRDNTRFKKKFKQAGIEYCAPCAGLSELLTKEIAKGHRFAMGCMRGLNGEPCKNCLKCHRKHALNGEILPTNREVEKVLGNDWIPVLEDYLHARDVHGLNHPRINNVERDYSWAHYWYSKSIEYIPKSVRDHFLRRLKDFGIEALEDDTSLVSWSAHVPKQ